MRFQKTGEINFIHPFRHSSMHTYTHPCNVYTCLLPVDVIQHNINLQRAFTSSRILQVSLWIHSSVSLDGDILQLQNGERQNDVAQCVGPTSSGVIQSSSLGSVDDTVKVALFSVNHKALFFLPHRCCES